MPSLPDVPGVRHADHALPTGVVLHVAEAGDPDAPAILAVHGWPQHRWLWRDVIRLLALRAPERLERLMAMSIVHPWTPRGPSLLNAWRILYQPPLAMPVLGPA